MCNPVVFEMWFQTAVGGNSGRCGSGGLQDARLEGRRMTILEK